MWRHTFFLCGKVGSFSFTRLFFPSKVYSYDMSLSLMKNSSRPPGHPVKTAPFLLLYFYKQVHYHANQRMIQWRRKSLSSALLWNPRRNDDGYDGCRTDGQPFPLLHRSDDPSSSGRGRKKRTEFCFSIPTNILFRTFWLENRHHSQTVLPDKSSPLCSA